MLRTATLASVVTLLAVEASAQTTADSTSLKALPSELAHDVGALPSGDAAKWAAIGTIATLAARPLDRPITNGLNQAETKSVRHLFVPGKFIGETAVEMGGAVVTYVVGRAADQAATEAAGLELLRAQLLTEGIVEGLKFTIRRERPDATNRRSFPSGHAAIAFATATVLQRRFGWAPAAPAYMVAGYVAMSRLAMDRHYLTDVVAGVFVGTIVARTVTRAVAEPSTRVAAMQRRGFALVWSIAL
ncbi:MAG: phosphatase PAP2 family protein [Thermoanaerobaculia bacterium]